MLALGLVPAGTLVDTVELGHQEMGRSGIPLMEVFSITHIKNSNLFQELNSLEARLLSELK